MGRDKGQTGELPAADRRISRNDGRNPKVSESGAGDGTRTRDALLGRQVLTFHRLYATKPLKMGTSRVSRLHDINKADARF